MNRTVHSAVRATVSSSSSLNPLRRTAPQGVAAFAAKETEMADVAHLSFGGRDRDDFRRDRSKSRTEHFDRWPRCPGIIGEAQRAHGPAIIRKVLYCRELGIVEQIAFAHDPVDPLQKGVLGQILTQTDPPRRITQ